MTSLAVLIPILDQTPVRSIEQALEVMKDLERALDTVDGRPSEGVAWFNRLYTEVTEHVAAAVADRHFENPQYVADLDAVFANLYFAALREYIAGSTEVPRAWWPLLVSRERTDIAPLQFAIAGMNAHINRDLPVALTTLWNAPLSTLPPREAQKRDYDRINQLLARVEQQVKGWFLHEPWQQLSAAFHGVDDVVAMFSVAEARAAAWVHGEVLFELGGPSSLLGGAYLEAFDGVVGLASRGLLVRTVH